MALKVQMYSFKGGAGRTVSTANIARVMATEKSKRVLAIDLDIESAGLSVLFGIDDIVEERRVGAIQDILRGSFEGPRDVDLDSGQDRLSGRLPEDDHAEVFNLGFASFIKHVWPRVNVHPNGYDNLSVVPARRIVTSTREPSVLEQMNQRFEQMLIHVQRMPNAPEVIFFDSASGIQNTATLGNVNCDVLMVFVRWSRQFVRGTRQFLREFANHSSGLHKLNRVIVVPTAVPNSPSATTAIRDFRAELQQAINAANVSADKHLRKPRTWITLAEGIPDAEELRWDDRILTNADLEHAKGSALQKVLLAYRNLADMLVEERSAMRRPTGG